jgi:hypothetical protein
MRRGKRHQPGEPKRDEAVFTESPAVKVRYILLRLSTPSRHNRAIHSYALNCAILNFALGSPREYDLVSVALEISLSGVESQAGLAQLVDFSGS